MIVFRKRLRCYRLVSSAISSLCASNLDVGNRFRLECERIVPIMVAMLAAIAGCNAAGQAHVDEPHQLQERASLHGHTDHVKAVAFSPDGKLLASGSSDAFSHDGKLLASASSDQTIKLWDVAAARLIATVEHKYHAINALEFSPDDRILATGGADQSVKIWQVDLQLSQNQKHLAKPVAIPSRASRMRRK